MAEETWRNYLENKNSKPAPLKGIKVLEIATLLLGPGGPGFLAKLGAEVIKCEMPPMGDTVRNLVPFGYYFREHGCGFTHPNLSKYWIGLDLHKPEGQKIFLELAAKADIIEENMRPGVLEKWNVGYRQIKEINPRIIYLSKNGYGQWGQYADENRPSNDGGSQAASGFAWMSSFPGKPPLKSRLYIADAYGGLMGEIPVLAALHYRERTGKGQYIDQSNVEPAVQWVAPAMLDYSANKVVENRAGNSVPYAAPHNAYPCEGKDSWCAIAVMSETEWGALCNVMGRPELASDPRFATLLDRKRNEAELDSVIGEWTADLTPDEAMERLRAAGVAAGKVATMKDIVEDKQLRHRGYYKTLDHPEIGSYEAFNTPYILSRTPSEIRLPAPCLGEHTEYVCRQLLDMPEEEFVELLLDNVFE